MTDDFLEAVREAAKMRSFQELHQKMWGVQTAARYMTTPHKTMDRRQV